MSEKPPAGNGVPSTSRLRRDVGDRARRKQRARRDPTVWFSLGMMGLIGWSVAIPTLIGVALGVWIDHSWPSRVSWTLTLLFVGVALGCFNAWRWVRQEGTQEQREEDLNRT